MSGCSFTSPVNAVANLFIHKFPKRRALLNVAKAGCRGRTVVVVDANGAIYSNVASSFHYSLGRESRYDDMFMLLREMHVLTSEQVKLHLKAAEERDEKQANMFVADDLRGSLRLAKLAPTKAQQAFIDKHGSKEKTR